MSQMEERGSQDHARLYPRFKVNEKYVEKWQHDAGWGYPRRNEDEKKKRPFHFGAQATSRFR
jgi:hypothetical protein